RTGMGSDIAANAGFATTALVLSTISEWGVGIKESLSGAWLATKGAVVGVATAPAAPYIAGGAVATYAGYKTYRYFKPTNEQQLKDAEVERKKQESLEQSETLKCKRERSQSIQELRTCVSRYRRSTSFSRSGLPVECADQELDVALYEDGDSEVLSMAKKFVQFAPIKKED